jgi:membrane protease YdiL (CAAX protease family)
VTDDGTPVLVGPLVVLLGVWNNLVAHRLPGQPASYPVWNAAAAGVVVTAARASGLSWAEMGLAPERLGSGVRRGGPPSAVVAAGCAVGAALPATRPVFADARLAGIGGRALAYQALVRIPVGTVLWEEIAFRGALQATLARLVPPVPATAASSVLFGVWHVRPTLDAVRANRPAAGAVRRSAAVLAGCAGTAVAGALFTCLRERSGSLLAPVLLHLSANVSGALAAAAVHRVRAGAVPRRCATPA